MVADGQAHSARRLSGPLGEMRIETRIRNGLDGGAQQRAGEIKAVSTGRSMVSRLKAKAKRILYGPADRLRRFFNAPVEQRVDINDIKQQLMLVRLDQLTDMIGKRLDELEVKMRPLVSLDDAYAVRLGDGYVLAPKTEPAFVLMLADATTGGLEPGTRACVKRLLRPGDTAVDIGANIGLLTMAFARSVGPAGKVYSFEPEKRMADLLERTIAMNGLSQVTLSRKAVSAEAGKLSFNVSSIPGHSSLFALPEQEIGHTQDVEVVRLDDVVPADEQVALVKIDVEGAELEVLKGMRRVVGDNPDIVVIAEFGISHLKRVGVSTRDWFAAFEALGLQGFAIEEPTGVCSPAKFEKLEAMDSVNIAFARSGQAGEKRLLA